MRYKLIPVICTAMALLWACGVEDAQPVQYKAPEVSFTMASDIIAAQVGESVTFTAKVVSGDKVSTGWYIDDVLTSSSQSFDYVFEQAGTYSVRFEARNGAGVVDHTYTVNVSDKLVVSLSVKDSTQVVRRQLEYLKVAAVVEYGKDVNHE